MPKMNAMPRPKAKKFKARTFRSLPSHTMSLMLGDPFWIVCVWVVIAYLWDQFDIISRTALHCIANIFDMCKQKNIKLCCINNI